MTKRTVYRDVATLIAQGVPIRGEPGVGYVLETGFHMPPLMLTADEVEAAVLGAQWVRSRGEAPLARAAETLMSKIKAVAPDRLQSSFAEPPTSVAPVAAPAETLTATEIRAAIRQRRKIALTYCDDGGRETERTIWPLLVGYRDAGRIVAAWCELREGFRYFRTERILRGVVLDAPIPQRMDLLRRDWRTAMETERRQFENLD